MKYLKRIFIKKSTRDILDAIAKRTGHPHTENTLKKLSFTSENIRNAVSSKYIEKYDFPAASIGGETISYIALRLTDIGKNIAITETKASETYQKLVINILATVIGGLILAFVFGVGR